MAGMLRRQGSSENREQGPLQRVEEPGRIRRGAEATSLQCGRFGKQELEVNMGTAWGCFGLCVGRDLGS